MKNIHLSIQALLIMVLLFTNACNNSQPENKATDTSRKTAPPVKEPIVKSTKGPVINIGDTLSIKQMVLTMKDSSATMERIGLKLGEIYGVKLAAIIKKNNLKITGAPMAWYKSEKAPYFFEAGLPVDKKPGKLPAGMFIKQIGIDSVVVAHFYGPYELIPQAYDALKEWITDHEKKIKGAPYEIYVDDPIDKNGKAKDPYKVQTDIVFSWK